MIKIPKNLSKQIGRCRSCKELIWWVYREGKALAFSVGIETDGTLYHWSKLHRETCPYAVDLEPAGPQNRRARADADSFAKNRWRTSCASDKELRPVDWNTVPIYDVPEKHAWRVAWKLTKRGGPFQDWHPKDIIPHLNGIAVKEQKVVAILVKPAFFNRIHEHFHRFAMSVFSDMAERKPVFVAGYRIEPTCVLRN